MAELNLRPIEGSIEVAGLTPLVPTHSGWIHCVLADFDSFLQDHASAEKKASGMALSMVSHYPNQTALVAAMVDLAVEELNHYKEVMRLLMAKGVTPAADRKDPYVTRLNKLVRKGLCVLFTGSAAHRGHCRTSRRGAFWLGRKTY